jgi:hypothetical protein
MDNYRFYFTARVRILKSSRQALFCGGSLIKYLGSFLRMRILVVVPPLVVLPMVVPPSFSLFSVLKPIFDDNLMCLVVTSSKLPLVEFGDCIPVHFT